MQGQYRDGQDVLIAVRDEGIGIDPAMLPQVFEMFVQEGQALDRSLGGLGLGLSIVRNVMALHGGSATVTSDGRGRGSEFTLRLPATDATTARPAGVPTAPSEGRAGGRRVLVVDDNDDGARLLADALRGDGHHVWTASDGPSALHLAAAMTPDVAILDIGLPGMDGYELAARLRGEQHLSRLHLVAVTGYGERATQDRSSAAGFAAHFVKPVDPAQLAETLRTLPAAEPR